MISKARAKEIRSQRAFGDLMNKSEKYPLGMTTEEREYLKKIMTNARYNTSIGGIVDNLANGLTEYDMTNGYGFYGLTKVDASTLPKSVNLISVFTAAIESSRFKKGAFFREELGGNKIYEKAFATAKEAAEDYYVASAQDRVSGKELPREDLIEIGKTIVHGSKA